MNQTTLQPSKDLIETRSTMKANSTKIVVKLTPHVCSSLTIFVLSLFHTFICASLMDQVLFIVHTITISDFKKLALHQNYFSKGTILLTKQHLASRKSQQRCDQGRTSSRSSQLGTNHLGVLLTRS